MGNKSLNMRLAVVIPAFNEENTISKVIKNIPKDCADSVIIIVVDDGSTDDTSEKAIKAGADKIIRHRQNMGLEASPLIRK
ncbi:MAG TPA: glycosyltransferase [Thermoplasmata archaeon]|nr:glycosyltransferase [Thermoplasmata archaeon]